MKMQNNDTYSHLENSIFFKKNSLLILGLLLMLLSDMRGSLQIIAWIMPAPFLVYVILFNGIKNHILLLLTLLMGSILTLAKASSDPYSVSLGFAVMSGLVTGIRFYIAFIIWSFVRKKTSELIGLIAFPSIIVSLEYLQAFHTPIGVWGALANTQLYNLSLLQTASLVGFLGISGIMAWSAVLIASLVLKGSLKNSKIQILSFLILLIFLGVYGDLRLDNTPKGKNLLVAGIMNNYKFTGTIPSPNDPVVLKNTNELIEKTKNAAQSGATLAVWGEASTVISENNEQTFLSNLSNLAKSEKIAIVAAYVVIPSKNGQNSKYSLINKFSWINKDGEIAETYLKHHILFKGTKKGIAPLKIIHSENINFAGAICFDYDFPKMSLLHSRLGADLIVLPGLDWRGMTRRHTLMSRIRAIEGGFSIVRPANDATSMGFDAYGQIRASMSYFGNNNKIMLTSLPAQRINTVYSVIGNTFAYVAIFIMLASIFLAIHNSKNRN